MSARTLHISLSESDASAAREEAAQQGAALPKLVTSLALQFAREHGFREHGQPAMWQRRSPFWGPLPTEPATVRLELSLTEAELAILESAAAYFKFQAPQGGFTDVSVGQFVAGATARSLRKPRAPADAGSRPETPVQPAASRPVPAGIVNPRPPTPSSLGTEGKYVLIVAVGVTVLALGAAILKKLDDRAKATVAVVVAPKAAAQSAPDNGEDGQEEGEKEEARDGRSSYQRPVYFGKSPLPSRAAATSIDALLEQRYGRPTVPVDANRDKSGSGPLWLAGSKPTKAKGYEALAGLLQALPRHQVYDVAIASALVDVAAIYPVPPALVKGIIRRESDFNPKAKSHVGAIGLMQVMPFNAKRLGMTEQELWDPEKNILAGVRLLAVLLKYYQGDVISALTAYNARPRELFAPVPRNGETPEYIAHVLKYYEEFHGSPLRDGLGSPTQSGAKRAPVGTLPPFATSRGE